MKFFTYKTKEFPRAAQNGLAPREEFIAHGKERFLAAFDASALASDRVERTAGMATFFKIGVVAMAAVCVAAGMSVYADTANVSATNPLYPLKRLSENVQLALTPASQKAQLQATFAVRRVKEIDALQASHPTSPLIPALTHDLDSEISSSLAAIVGAPTNSSTSASTTIGIIAHGHAGVFDHSNSDHGQAASSSSTTIPSSTEQGFGQKQKQESSPLNVYCAAFNNGTSSVLFSHLEGELVAHPDVLTQFNLECGSKSHSGDSNGTTSNEASSSPDSAILGTSIGVTTAASSTIAPQIRRANGAPGDN